VFSTLSEIDPRPAPVEVLKNLLDRGLTDGTLSEPNRIFVYLVFLSWLYDQFTVISEERETFASLKRSVGDLLTVGVVVPLLVYDPRRILLE
jgi:uncharacterized membrane protein